MGDRSITAVRRAGDEPVLRVDAPNPAEGVRAWNVQQRLAFLVEAAEMLAGSLDYGTTLENVARLVVPRLADWCSIDVLDDEGQVQRGAVMHSDPARLALADEYRKQYPIRPDEPGGVAQVLRTGDAELYPEITDEMLQASARSPEHLALLRGLGLHSALFVPLSVGARVLGVMTLVSDTAERRYGQDDLRFAGDLAHCCALAVDNARLYRAAQDAVHQREDALEQSARQYEELRESRQHLKELNETLERRIDQRGAEAERRTRQLRDLAAELIQTEQRERRRLAQVLHDHLQQLLVAGRMQLSLLRRKMQDISLIPAVHQIDTLIVQSIDASRSLTVELSPPVLYDASLAAALEWLGRNMHEKYGLLVDVHTETDAGGLAEDMRVFLFQAVREMLFNVVKHAGVDRASVHLAASSAECLMITVEDRGRGFDPEILTSGDKEVFGLFSIQERLEYLGGRLELETAPGQGTRFLLHAPCDESPVTGDVAQPPDATTDRSNDREAAADAGESDHPRVRVLLVDDHRIVRAGLAGLLRGYADLEVVGEASDGRMAVEMARTLRPDVISMDITMPGMNGIEATRLITAEVPNVRVIGLSMHESADMAAAMIEAGASAYFPKDGPSDALLAAIRGTLL